MRSHDLDIEQVGRTRESVTPKGDQHTDLAARVLSDGRPAALDQPAVVHLQASAGNASVSRLLADEEGPRKVKEVLGSGGGERLDPDTAQEMGQRFGHEFGDVRIHRDARASDSAHAVNAHAYTVGSDIVFQAGRYDPTTESGKRILAHELTHVVQQRSGPVDGTPVGGEMRISHPADRFEQAAERTADRVMATAGPEPPTPTSAPAPVQRDASQASSVPNSALQRQAEEEEEPEAAAGYIAQRQGEEEEEEPEAAAGYVAQRQGEEEEEEPAPA